jgi:outer membrane protein assembly factor BamB
MTLVDGVAYAGTLDNAVYALRVSDGSLLWRFNTNVSVDDSPLVANGVVYVRANVAQGPGYLAGYVFALRASDGTLLWRFTRGNYVSTPTVVNGVAYVGSGDGTLSALRASDGTLLWRYTTKGTVDDSPLVVNGVVLVNANVDQGPAYLYALRASDGSLLWRYATPQGFAYMPTVVNGVAYTDAPEGLVALRVSDGTLLWRYSRVSTGTGFSFMTVLNGIVYTIGTKFSSVALDAVSDHTGGYLLQTNAAIVPSKEKTPFKSAVASVYALRASDGALLWQYSMNNGKDNWGTFLSVVNGVVYVGANVDVDTNYIYALQASNGSLLWRSTTKDALSSALVTNGIIYVGSDGTMYALRASDGSVFWRSAIYGIVLNMPILVGGLLYVGTTSGFVYAMQAGNGSLLWHYLTDVS